MPTCILSLCEDDKGLAVGKNIHLYLSRFDSKNLCDATVATALLNMYIRCQVADKALGVWHVLDKQRRVLIVSNKGLLASIFQACSKAGTQEMVQVGECILEFVESLKKHLELVVATAAMCMYVKSQQPQKAVTFWKKLQKQNLQPDSIFYVSVLSLCAEIGPSVLGVGEALQSHILAVGKQDTIVSNALIIMFTKCGKPETAIPLGDKMLDNHTADLYTYSTLLRACAEVGTIAKAFVQRIYDYTNAFVYHTKDIVLLNSLISACGKCGLAELGLSVWKNMQHNSSFSQNIYICTRSMCRVGQPSRT
jgi:pentatricopeptide repeat protein